MLDQRRTALLGASRPAVPLIDIGELTSTRSRPSDGSVSTSALVGEWTPPSTYAVPAIETGAKKPGIAHDAATASATA